MLLKIKGIKKVHMVGIGGSGMSGIAEVLRTMGYEISGSDIKKTDITLRLESLGCKIFHGHRAKNIGDAEVVVVSSAVKKNNPEVLEAQRNNIPVIQRAEMLAELMRLKYSICVSGAHGKSTTTSMIGKIFQTAGFDPTIVVGGKLRGVNTGGYLGLGDFLIAEADESDRSFLKLFPTTAVITNIDKEHLDTYKTMKTLKKVFFSFLSKIPFYGSAILFGEDKNLKEIGENLDRRVIFYGFNKENDVWAKRIRLMKTSSRFLVHYQDKNLGEIKLTVPGEHNVLNALATVATCLEMGIPFWVIQKGFHNFEGVSRRFEFKGKKGGIGLLDDYAHHPTEISFTLKAVKKFWTKGKIYVIFQPHRYTRTKLLSEEFGGCFEGADYVYILPIYPAGESPISGVSSSLIYRSLKKHGSKNVFLVDKNSLKQKLKVKKGDLIVTLGAGDVWKIGETLHNEITKGR